MRIALGSDHGGFKLKQAIAQYLTERGIEYVDFGTMSECSVDYPDFALAVAEAVRSGQCDRGILVCGTGIGIGIAANKVPGIRAALCHDTFSARFSRQHNDANILTLGERVIGTGLALEIVDVWLHSEFEGGRHARRVDKIAAIERKYGAAEPPREQEVDLVQVAMETRQAVSGLLAQSSFHPHDILVVGCSTSEVAGRRIGSAGSLDIAAAIFQEIQAACQERELYLAVQCCEHLNRALVVEEACAREYRLEIVNVVPHAKAGGALAEVAMNRFTQPVVVAEIKAHLGMDIGDTFIGMHLRPVVVPVRLPIQRIGQAHLTLARTRPKLIGGERAKYSR
ncbi:MAG TPA: TIGR01440 family protein [Clostridia bacterium]|nr:TIGR01440 family protein [Clostridia bacterium]